MTGIECFVATGDVTEESELHLELEHDRTEATKTRQEDKNKGLNFEEGVRKSILDPEL